MGLFSHQHMIGVLVEYKINNCETPSAYVGYTTYECHVEAEHHSVGKPYMQRIESKHINLRTRIKRLMRRTICFSKTQHMHDLVIGLFVNRYAFGRAI